MMDTIEVCKIAGEMLQRADVKGREVPAWTEAYNFINAIFAGELIVTPKGAYTKLQEDNEDLAKIKSVYRKAPSIAGLQAYIDSVREQPAPDQPQPFFEAFEEETEPETG